MSAVDEVWNSEAYGRVRTFSRCRKGSDGAVHAKHRVIRGLRTTDRAG